MNRRSFFGTLFGGVVAGASTATGDTGYWKEQAALQYQRGFEDGSRGWDSKRLGPPVLSENGEFLFEGIPSLSVSDSEDAVDKWVGRTEGGWKVVRFELVTPGTLPPFLRTGAFAPFIWIVADNCNGEVRKRVQVPFGKFLA